jgi:uncharacterized membrane protein HdeD (DUF308 family)
MLSLSATVAITVSTGALLAAAGAIALISAIGARHLPGFGLSLLLSLVPLCAGIWLFRNLNAGWVDLTVLFAVYFALMGSVTALLAVAHRRSFSSRWEWLLLSGVLSMNLALVIFSGLPGPFISALGVVLGADLIIAGSARLAIALGSGEVADGRRPGSAAIVHPTADMGPRTFPNSAPPSATAASLPYEPVS